MRSASRPGEANWTRLAVSAFVVLGCLALVHQVFYARESAPVLKCLEHQPSPPTLSKQISADPAHHCPASCTKTNAAAAAAQTFVVARETARQYVNGQLAIPSCREDDDKRLGGAVVAALSVFQQHWGIIGAVGEIGIEVGCFFMNMAITARKGEQLFALDIFGQQDKNLDQSGFGVKETFLQNCAALGIQPGDLTIFEGLSTELNVSSFCSLAPQAFRLFSIDGGHFSEVVFTDLLFAECHLADGGIALMDDYSNHFWPGVNEGVITYFNKYNGTTRLAPFLLTANKLFITTVSHQKRFFEAVTSLSFWDEACDTTPFIFNGKKICFEAPNVNTGNFWKFKLAGFPLAVAQDRGFNKGKTIQMWLDQLQKLT